jgi:ParB-like chromosome segregation protein Spo0J
MQIKEVAVNKLIPYAKNSRTHSPEQVGQIAASIKEFGFRNPILVDGVGIIAGHGRLMAAQKLGLDKVPTIDCSDMTESQKKAYIIADNKLALNAGWDNAMLTVELQDLEDEGFDLKLLGFDDKELDALLNKINFDPATEEDQGKLDQLDPKWIDCPHCGKEFDARAN